MSALLHAASCCFLLIDPRKEHLSQFDQETQNGLTRNFELLEQALRRVTVPIHIVFVSRTPEPDESLSKLEGASDARMHVSGSNGSFWSSSALAATLGREPRRALVLAGFWLETTVTFTALSALAAGFDVFIIMDATPPGTADARSAAINRLLQAGGVPTTTHQLIAEWTETTSDLQERAALSLLVSTH
jgi:nicotinamidase-related amidase